MRSSIQPLPLGERRAEGTKLIREILFSSARLRLAVNKLTNVSEALIQPSLSERGK